MNINKFFFDLFIETVKEDKAFLKTIETIEDDFSFDDFIESKKDRVESKIRMFYPNEKYPEDTLSAINVMVDRQGIDGILKMIDKPAINRMMGGYFKVYFDFKKKSK